MFDNGTNVNLLKYFPLVIEKYFIFEILLKVMKYLKNWYLKK